MSKWKIEAGQAAWNAIKPLAKTGAKTVGQWKSSAAKARLKMSKENLEQTFKESDKVLKKFGETVKKQKKILDK
jgi:ABC-type transport system involved in cytochrome bd biosynthesis fused ATPase/permease subunit